MTPANWITLILFALAAIGAILKAQHSLITKLLADRWAQLERRQTETEAWKDETDTRFGKFDRRITRIETVCQMRHVGPGLTSERP